MSEHPDDPLAGLYRKVPPSKEVNALLKAELLARVTPQLAALGFKPLLRVRHGKLPFRFWRDLGSRIDMLEFQWDKHKGPSFIINFRPVEAEADILRFRADPKGNWDELYGAHFRATHGSRRVERWFRLSIAARLFFPERGIRRVVDSVSQRVVEIDRFLNGDAASRYIRPMPSPYRLDQAPHELFRPPSRMSEE